MSKSDIDLSEKISFWRLDMACIKLTPISFGSGDACWNALKARIRADRESGSCAEEDCCTSSPPLCSLPAPAVRCGPCLLVYWVGVIGVVSSDIRDSVARLGESGGTEAVVVDGLEETVAEFGAESKGCKWTFAGLRLRRASIKSSRLVKMLNQEHRKMKGEKYGTDLPPSAHCISTLKDVVRQYFSVVSMSKLDATAK